MGFPSPANAGEKWLYVSDIWDGTHNAPNTLPVYSTYNNILGNAVNANQTAVNTLLGYAYSQGYTGLFLYNMNKYMSGGVFNPSLADSGANAKTILRSFIGQATAMGLDVGGVTNTSTNSLDAFIDYNNTSVASERFSCVVTENEWWWWSYDDVNPGPCGELGFIQMKNNLSSRKVNLTAAGLPIYAYIGWCNDALYPYGTGLYTCGSPPVSANRNGSVVGAQSEVDELIGIVDKFMFHDYVTTTPKYSYMRSRLLMVTAPIDVLWIVSSELAYSKKFFQGQDAGGSVIYPLRGIEDAYDYISHNLGLTSPAQVGTSYDQEADASIQTNINVVGITNFSYNQMVNRPSPIISKNGPTIYVNAGTDTVVTGPTGSTALSGLYKDDLLPLGATYTILWSKTSGPAGSSFSSTSSLTPTFSFILPGIYVLRLTVTDSGGATNFDEVTISVTGTVSSVTSTISLNAAEGCVDDCTAILDCTAGGGTGPYTYLWSPGGNTTSQQTGVCNGDTYTCVVTDALLATGTDTFTYTNLTLPITVTGVVTDVSCNGDTDGQIVATGSGTFPPFQWDINGGGFTVPYTASKTYTSLAPGNYTITARDSKGCTGSAVFAVLEPNVLSTSYTTRSTTCDRGSDGAVDLTVLGGTLPYSYAWSNGAITQDLTNVVAGIYTCTVTDAHGCTAPVTATVPAGPSIGAYITQVGTGSICTGESVQYTMNTTAGTAPFTYSWSTGETTQVITRSFATSGVFTISCTITDANGCTDLATVIQTIFQTPAIPIPIAITGRLDTCNIGTTVDLTATLDPVYTSFVWNTGETINPISVSTPGVYACTGFTTDGCDVIGFVTVPAAIPLSITVTLVAEPACSNISNTGQIDSTTTGGCGPYTYEWLQPGYPPFRETTEDITNLFPGYYTVTVTDSVGNTATAGGTVGVSYPTGSIRYSNILCHNANDGSIEITATGGTPGYTYLTTGPNGYSSTNFQQIGLAPGIYTWTITDDLGCTDTGTVFIQDIAPIIANEVHVNPTSDSSSDGAINVTVLGGLAPYTHSWNTGQTTANITNLPAGTYVDTITDANGCVAILVVVLTTITLNELILARAECCYADEVYLLIKAEKLGRKDLACFKKKLTYMRLVICLMARYVAGDSCITADDFTFLTEQISTICGCCSCTTNTDLYNDTL